MTVTAAQARLLIAYNRWANEKVLAAIATLPADELQRPRDAYVGSIANNVRHVLVAQRVWRARWRGETPPPLSEQHADLQAVYAASHAAIAAYAEALSDADCDAVLRYTSSDGAPHAMPLGQLISHVVNHGTHHRAETGMLLERLGRSPGDMDFIHYCYEALP